MIVLANATKGKAIDVKPNNIKIGQKDQVTAPSIRLEFTVTNHELDKVTPGLRAMLFTKPSTDPGAVKARQQPLDGVEPVTDLPSLSPLAVGLGTFNWHGEQTGCIFTIIRGTGTKVSNIKLEGCKVWKWQFTPQEGGSVKCRCTIDATIADELDDSTAGKFFKLKKRGIEFTLEAPTVDNSQSELEEEEEGLGGGAPDPTAAFVATAGKNGAKNGAKNATAH
jgi:hypothetical protein